PRHPPGSEPSAPSPSNEARTRHPPACRTRHRTPPPGSALATPVRAMRAGPPASRFDPAPMPYATSWLRYRSGAAGAQRPNRGAACGPIVRSRGASIECDEERHRPTLQTMGKEPTMRTHLLTPLYSILTVSLLAAAPASASPV